MIFDVLFAWMFPLLVDRVLRSRKHNVSIQKWQGKGGWACLGSDYFVVYRVRLFDMGAFQIWLSFTYFFWVV